jgi:HK97 family phage portal protein
MAFWNRKGTVEERAQTSGMALPQTWLADALGGPLSPSGKRVTVHGALGISAVWAAVSMISEQVGQLPLKVYREADDGREEARAHRAWSMLHDRPNEHTPADRFWSTCSTHILLYGNAFLRKHRDGLGLVDELSLLNPAYMSVYWDGDQLIKQYRYQPPTGQMTEFDPGDVLHIFGLSLDGVLGESVITRCKAAFGAALARDEYEGGFYARGATLSGLVKHPARLSPDAIVNLKQSISSIFGGSAKAHQVGVLEEGADWISVGSPLKDLQFVESQQMSRTDIAVMFKLPPNYLGGTSGDSLTYATVESNQLQFALHAIAPITNAIAKALTTDSGIFPQSIYSAEFSIDAMLRADTGARAAYYKTMTEVQAITPNEIRHLENLPPLDGGDEVKAPTAERISVAEPQAPGTPPPTPPPPVPGAGPPPPQLAAISGS